MRETGLFTHEMGKSYGSGIYAERRNTDSSRMRVWESNDGIRQFLWAIVTSRRRMELSDIWKFDFRGAGSQGLVCLFKRLFCILDYVCVR